jgi:hypothetical protein
MIQDKAVWGSKDAGSGFGRTPCVAAIALVTVLVPGKAVWGQAHAWLAPNVERHVQSRSTTPVDVIVRGTLEEIDAIAGRQHFTINKRLDESAVFQVNAVELDALSNEPPLAYLSRNVQVTSFMAVTDPAIGADQVWAGVAGLRGFTGTGIGVALIDSGVWTQHVYQQQRSQTGWPVWSGSWLTSDIDTRGRPVGGAGPRGDR